MRERLLLCGIVACMTLLSVPLLRNTRADLIGVGAPVSITNSSLPACEGSPALFPEDTVDTWDDAFRSKVKRVLAADAQATVQCTEGTITPATTELRALASSLPQWGADRSLTEADLPEVLLDYLDTYGCALRAAAPNILAGVQSDIRAGKIPNAWNKQAEAIQERGSERQDNLDATREVMKQVLLQVIQREKLRPLEDAFTCLNRASKDLRNIFNLLSDGSACIPVKTWDAKTPLRDLSTMNTQP